MVVMLLGLAAGCGETGINARSAREPIAETMHSQRMLVPSRLPIIAAERPEDLEIARRVAERVDAAALARGAASQWVGVDALPLLSSTGIGRQFLNAAMPRALARGEPPQICPALAMAAGASGPGAAGRAATAVAALEACLGQLNHAGAGCGCRVVALDAMVTVPREEVAYAKGTMARLRLAERGIDLVLVAEEDGAGSVVLRDLSGPVARLEHAEGRAVTLTMLGDGRQFRGFSIPVGFRRGRLAERVYAKDESGTRLSLLIGFSPDEIAQRAGAWLAWPSDG